MLIKLCLQVYMMSVGVKQIPHVVAQKFARELLKVLIRKRTLLFCFSELEDVVADLDLPEGVDVYDVVDVLDEKLRSVELAVVSDKAVDPCFLIVPAKLAEDERLLDALFKIADDIERTILELVANFLSSCGLAAAPRGETGIALPFVKVAECWGVVFEKDYSLFSNSTYTGVIKLCLDDACIYERVYYCNYVCNAHGIFKCSEYMFEPGEYRDMEES